MTTWAHSPVVQAQGDNKIPIKNMLIVPSLTTVYWHPDDFWAQTYFLDQHTQDLNVVVMERRVFQSLV